MEQTQTSPFARLFLHSRHILVPPLFLSTQLQKKKKNKNRTKYSRQFKPHFAQRYLEQLTALSEYFCQVFMMVAFVHSPESIFFLQQHLSLISALQNFCSVNRWPAESLISMVRDSKQHQLHSITVCQDSSTTLDVLSMRHQSNRSKIIPHSGPLAEARLH